MLNYFLLIATFQSKELVTDEFSVCCFVTVIVLFSLFLVYHNELIIFQYSVCFTQLQLLFKFFICGHWEPLQYGSQVFLTERHQSLIICFLTQPTASGSSCIFTTPDLESAIPPKSPSSFQQKIVFGIHKLGPRDAHCYRIVIVFRHFG